MIIERSKWVCSIALMSAFGIAIFGVAGASGRGSAWSAVHPAKGHVIVVHSHGSAHVGSPASNTYSSHVSRSPVSHAAASSDYSSHATVVHATAGPTTSYAGSAKPVHDSPAPPAAAPAATAPAATHASAPAQSTTHTSHASHVSTASHAARSHGSAHDSQVRAHRNIAAASDTDATDSAAVSAQLGAWTGASVSVQSADCPGATDPTGTATPPVSDPAPGTPTCGSDTGTGDTGTGNNGQSNTVPDQGDQGTGSGQGDQGTGSDQGDQGDQGTGSDQGDQDEQGDQGDQGDQGTGSGSDQCTTPSAADPAATNPIAADPIAADPTAPTTGSTDPCTGTDTGQGTGSDAGSGEGCTPSGSTGDTGDTGDIGEGTTVTPPTDSGDPTSSNGGSDQMPETSTTPCSGGGIPGIPQGIPNPGGEGDTGTPGSPLGVSSGNGSTGSGSPSSGPTGSAPPPVLPGPGTTPSGNTGQNPPPSTSNPSGGNSLQSSTGSWQKIGLPSFPGGTPTETLTSTPAFGNGAIGSAAGAIGSAAGAIGSAAGTPGAAAAAAAGGASGLGTLTPATSQIGLAGNGASDQAGARAESRAKDEAKGRTTAPVTGPVTLPSFVGQPFQGIANDAAIIIDKIPWYIWVALGALAVVAAGAVGAAYRSGRLVRRQAGAMAAVSAAALTDPLTGVLNRRGFTEAVERELARARRYNRPFVLAYADVRGLKAVNDTEGHLAGDELLKGASSLLRDSARADDVVGRLGGDELGLLLVEQSPEGAEAVTSRIQSMLPARHAELGILTPWDLTIGIAAFPEDGQTFNELLAVADQRLYEKRGIDIRRETQTS
jgi:diguanylate cyclase (GGDEF)-like protein